MKVNFNRVALAEALGLITSVVSSKSPKPILRCVKLAAENDEVRISGTDMEAGINYALAQVEVETAGTIVVPADKLSAIVRESTDDVLLIESEEGICKITGNDAHYTVYGQEAEYFPEVPAFDGEADMQITLENLQAGIEQTLFATAKESTRYALNGVLWEVTGKKLSFVATDGRRLAKARESLTAAPSELAQTTKIIVPAKTMSLLDKIGASKEDVVSIKIVDNQILIACANVVISSNLVDGNFPKYEDIIPKDYDKRVELSVASILSAVRRTALLSTDESRGIRVAIGANRIEFSCKSPEAGDAKVELPIEYTGEAIEIGFNPQFMIDVLRVIRSDTFEIELGQPDRPGLLKSGKDFLYVIMPISLG